MNLNDALALIASFGKTSFTGKESQALGPSTITASYSAVIASLANNTHQILPVELVHYIEHVCPAGGLTVDAVGHAVELLPATELAWQPSMYSGLTGELAKWQDDWLLIAHEGGDPIIVKTTEQGKFSPVYSAMQGMGFWDFAPIADSIGQFLVCICAIEHALNFPGLNQPLDDDFNLAPAAANWLFPLLRQHAGSYYDEWASVFENYQLG